MIRPFFIGRASSMRYRDKDGSGGYGHVHSNRVIAGLNHTGGIGTLIYNYNFGGISCGVDGDGRGPNGDCLRDSLAQYADNADGIASGIGNVSASSIGKHSNGERLGWARTTRADKTHRPDVGE